MNKLVICTSFDNLDKPLRSLIFNNGDVTNVDLYRSNTGKSLYQINKDMQLIKEIIESKKVVLNNFKQHLNGFKLDPEIFYRIYDSPITCKEDDISITKCLQQLVNRSKKPWMKILANASQIYQILENRGISYDEKIFYPKYHTTVFTGRSSTSGFNIQGKTIDNLIGHRNLMFNYFICFDWIAADLRAASILSKDKLLEDCFRYGDPYEYIAKITKVDRSTAKLSLLKGVYSLQDNKIIQFFPIFNKWLKERKFQIEKNNKSKTLLGRIFVGRNTRSLLNATIQGFVAHGMQCVLWNTAKECDAEIFTELHDELILCCNKDNITNIIDIVLPIMSYPFQGILTTNPMFPVNVKIGKMWKKWQEVKRLTLSA